MARTKGSYSSTLRFFQVDPVHYCMLFRFLSFLFFLFLYIGSGTCCESTENKRNKRDCRFIAHVEINLVFGHYFRIIGLLTKMGQIFDRVVLIKKYCFW